MHSRTISRVSRFSVALAAAALVMIVPAAAPASADGPAKASGSVLPPSPAVTVMPDMGVSFVVKIPNANGQLPYYMFKVKNFGGTTAKQVKIVKVATLRYSSNNQFALTQSQEITQVAISPGQEQSHVATCTPPPGTYCSTVGVMIQSVGNGDANPDNNQFFVAG